MLFMIAGIVVLIAIGAIFQMGLTKTRASLTVIAFGLALPALVMAAPPVAAAEAPVELGTTESYSVLGGQTVTNIGPTTLFGDLGVFPGTAVTGFPPGGVSGTIHAGDTAADQAQSDLVTAYDDAAGRMPTATVAGDLVGQTLTAGVYKSTGPLALSGTLTLDAENNPDAVFIFQGASTLITASDSTVELVNGAQACHVFWQAGSSVTIGTNSTFVGTMLALTSISVTTGSTVEGRALARNGAVTLDNNTFTDASCDTPVTTTTAPEATTTTSIPVDTTTTTAPEATTTTSIPVDTTTPEATTTTSIPVDTTTTTAPEATTTTTSVDTTTTTAPVSDIPSTTDSGMTQSTLPSTGSETPGTTQELPRTGWPTTPLVLLGGFMVTIGLVTLLIGRDRSNGRIGE